MRSVGWLGNDDGRVIFSTPTQTPTQGLCFVRGLFFSRRLWTYWEIPSEASSAIQSIGCRPAVGLSLSKDHMPRGSPVPNCRDGLGEILTQRGAWAQLACASTNDVPQCMAKVRAIIHSQPASRQPAQPTETEAGGFLPPAYASQTVSHVVARVPYRQGRRPLQITRVVSLLWGASIASSARAVSFARTQYPDRSWGVRLCRGCNTVPFSAVPAAAHFDRHSAEQHTETLFRKQRDERID